MPFVWSIDKVVVSGKTADRFTSVHCVNDHYITAVLHSVTVLKTYNKENKLTQAKTSDFALSP